MRRAPPRPASRWTSPARPSFQCSSDIVAKGFVELEGTSEKDWTLGFLQVEWTDTNWLCYRGQAEADGSIFFQRSRPPARPMGVCRDVDPDTDVFYTDQDKLAKLDGTEKLPLKLTVDHLDSPDEFNADVVVVNSLTKKPNFLSEVQLEFFFCTVLSLRDPKGDFHDLNGFYWNVRWQAKLAPLDFAKPDSNKWKITVDPKGSGQGISKVFKGGPDDKRFKGKFTDLKVPGCNAIIPLYTKMPAGHKGRHESKSNATLFDVTK